MEKYNPKQVEEIASMILLFGNYVAHQNSSDGLPGLAKGPYEIMTPLEIRNKVEELKKDPNKIEELVGDEERIERRIFESIKK